MKAKKILILSLLVVIAGAVAYYQFAYKESADYSFKTAPVKVRDVVQTIDATGTVEPEELVDVGARVSGEIVSFGKDRNGKEIDYGSTVIEGDVIALIDDVLQRSSLLKAQAEMELAKASQEQAKANLVLCQTNLRQAERDWNRAKRLGVSEALSQASYDSYLSAWEQATAQISVAQAQISQANASVEQAEAGLKEAQRNLEYCVIKAPVNGVIIDRKVNIGQTVVSSMTASSLFLIAKDLKKMEVWASVNEADIGGIRLGQPVDFTVDAFPGVIFKGEVGKIRLNATMSQNVVTYVVEVITDNSDEKLLPYLSANLYFEVAREDGVLSVPNSALRWSPEASYVEEKFRGIEPPDGEDALWVPSGNGKVRPVFVKVGISDGAFTSVHSPDLKEGMRVVTGISEAKSGASKASPFMPKVPQRKKGNTIASSSSK